MTMKADSIGFGIMDKPMSKNLLKAGYSLMVAGRNPEATADVIAISAETASTAKVIAERRDVIIIMPPNSPHVKGVALDENGIIEGTKPGTALIDMSSIVPLANRRINEVLKVRGIDILDAPVSGGEPKAIDGTLSMTMGGDKAIFNKYYDLMKAMAGSVMHIEEIGIGNVTKLASQIIVTLSIAAISEALILATKAGVNPDPVYQIIRGGLTGNTVPDAKVPMAMDRNFKLGFRIGPHIRDLTSALGTSHGVSTQLPFTAAITKTMQVLRADGLGIMDRSVLVCYHEKLAKVKVTRQWRRAQMAYCDPGLESRPSKRNALRRHVVAGTNMKIAIASDSYKEDLSASEVTQVIEKGLQEIFPGTQYVSVPVADGDEETVGMMIAVTQGAEHHVRITGPPGGKVNASWGISGDGKTALIEMTAASGLELVPAEKCDPLVTTSHDTNELTLQALESGATDIIIGIGGSATNDGDAGVIQALGVELCDASGNETDFGGGSLNTLNNVDISGLGPRLKDCVIHVACDITNPLVGDNSASRIFGPQKGASKAMIVELDNNLSHYAGAIKKALHVDVRDVLSAGAADGMGVALTMFLDAELKSNTGTVIMTPNLKKRIHDCTLAIIGEERINSQNIHDRIPIGVANVAKKYHRPVIGVVNNLTNDVGIVHQHGIGVAFNVSTSTGTLDEVLRGAYDDIYRTSRNVAATLATGMHNVG